MMVIRLLALAAVAVLAATAADTSAGATMPERAWVRLFGGPGDDSGAAVAVAWDGSVYVAGSIAAAGGTSDAFLAKFRNGRRVWLKRLGGTADDWATGVAVAPGGAIYITGTTRSASLGGGPDSGSQAFVARYDRKGRRQWVTPFGGAGEDTATSVTVGRGRAVYVAGGTNSRELAGQVNAGGFDIMVARFDPVHGQLRGLRLLGGPGFDYAGGISAAPDGTVYVAGYTEYPRDGAGSIAVGGPPPDALVARLGPNLSHRWTRRLQGRAEEKALAVVAGQDGAYIAGYTTSRRLRGEVNSGGRDAFIAHYEPGGRLAWLRLWGGAHNEVASGIAFDAEGAIYIAGEAASEGAGGEGVDPRSMMLARYTAGGVFEGQLLVDGGAYEAALGVAAGEDGIYITGHTTSPRLAGHPNAGGSDVVLVRSR